MPTRTYTEAVEEGKRRLREAGMPVMAGDTNTGWEYLTAGTRRASREGKSYPAIHVGGTGRAVNTNISFAGDVEKSIDFGSTVGTGKKASEVAAKVGSRNANEATDLTFGEATLVARFDREDRGEAEKRLAGGYIDLYLDGWIIEAKEKATRTSVDHVKGTLDRRIRDAEFVLEFVGTAGLFGSRPSDDDIAFLHEGGHVVIYEDENGLFNWVRP